MSPSWNEKALQGSLAFQSIPFPLVPSRERGNVYFPLCMLFFIFPFLGKQGVLVVLDVCVCVCVRWCQVFPPFLCRFAGL